MSTIASRRIRSSPHRDSAQTWRVIVDLLTQGHPGAARDELLSIVGVASALIADRVLAQSALVVTCKGPRTRLYCLYDEDAVEGSDAQEDALVFDPLGGDWSVSLPCSADDLPWVRQALAEVSLRITARDQAQTLGESDTSVTKGAPSAPMAIDVGEFLKP
jgi:hypothetical protein